MAITKADLDQVKALDGSVPEDSSLACLPSVAAVIAYVAATARAENEDEADHVETVIRLAEMPPNEVRTVERELRQLGYIKVCDRLRQIAGRRKHELTPLR